MNELALRTISAALLLLLAAFWFFWLPERAYTLSTAVLGALAAWEGARFLRLSAPWAIGLAAGACAGLGPERAWISAALAALALGLAGMRARADFGALFAASWIAAAAAEACAVLIAWHPAPEGRMLLIGAALAVWVADIAAYLIGRRFGRHRLCPAISPGKSWEGLVAALIASASVGAAWWHAQGLAWGAALGVGLAVVGIVGDLAISAAKRLAGVKDSGHWIPGHGGLLDRVDALLVALPVLWVWRG
ncbi:MAG: phosphatidate cytidylyltransferase [Zetaproteobacteria bacterium]|nr:MAG: phosphatidate cytidylyltransferase [Zetaproteobacteria bacterium]